MSPNMRISGLTSLSGIDRRRRTRKRVHTGPQNSTLSSLDIQGSTVYTQNSCPNFKRDPKVNNLGWINEVSRPGLLMAILEQGGKQLQTTPAISWQHLVLTSSQLSSSPHWILPLSGPLQGMLIPKLSAGSSLSRFSRELDQQPLLKCT